MKTLNRSSGAISPPKSYRNPNSRAESAGNFTMEVDSGEFGFITGSCLISPTQEDVLEDCAYLGESEVPYEEEELLGFSGEQAVDSTGVFMVSPLGSTQAARDDSITPQETYHTPPEEAVPRSSSSLEEAVVVNGGCRDGERIVDLGRDDDVGVPERKETAAQQLCGPDRSIETGKGGALKRGPSSDGRASKRPRLSGGNEGPRGSPAEGTKILEVKLYVETQDAYEGMFREKLKESLEKAVGSLKVYGPMVLRGIKIHGGTLIKRKLNMTVKLDDAPATVDLEVDESENVPEPGASIGTDRLDDTPRIVDLEVENVPDSAGTVKLDDTPTIVGLEFEESEIDPEPGRSTDKGEADGLIGTDSAQMARGPEVRDVAEVPNFTYEGGKDLPFLDKGKAVGKHPTDGIRDSELLKAHAGDDPRGETSTEINVTVENVQRPGCDMGPKEAETDCVRGAESVEKIEKLSGSSGKDTPVRNKGKAIAESEEIGIRRGENPRAQANDEREGQSSVVIDIQKDKDGSWHKQDGRDSLGSVTDVEVIGVSRKKHMREVGNVKEIEKVRYNREKDLRLPDKEKVVAGQEEIFASGGNRSEFQTRDDREAHKQDGRDSLGSLIEAEMIGISQKTRMREVENVEDIEKFRYNREKDLRLPDKEKVVAGQDESGSEVQTLDDREAQIPMEIDGGVERSQKMGVKDNKSSKSSDIDENLRILPASVRELAQHALGRVEASSRRLKVKAPGVFNVQGKVAEACEGRDLEEGSVVDFARKHGITFPHPISQRQK